MLSNIDQLFYFQRIGRGGGFCLVWRNGKKTSFTTAIPDEVDELVEVISSHLKKFKQSAGNLHFLFQSVSLSISTVSLSLHITDQPLYILLPSSFLHPSVKQIQLLKDIFKCKSTRFDIDNEEHVILLKRLWETLMPKDPLPPGKSGEELVGKHWKKIGFQGMNPATDFRKYLPSRYYSNLALYLSLFTQ